MKKARETKQTRAQKVTVAVRVSSDLRQYYEGLAAREIRGLSDVLRIALEDQARAIQERGGKLIGA